MAGKPPSSPRALATRPDILVAQERALKAYALRVQGYTLGQICEELGYSNTNSVRKAIKRVMARHEADTVSDARAWANARIEAVIRVLWPEVQEGKLNAIDRFIRAVELHARMNGVIMGNSTQISVENVLHTAPAVAIMPQPVDYRTAMKPILSAPDQELPSATAEATSVIDGHFTVAGSETGPE